MDYTAITGFCFTYAIPGGAWIEDAHGYRDWRSYSEIINQLGEVWWDARMRQTGWMTGCWVQVPQH